MIKARLHSKGKKPILLLGLTRKDMNRLLESVPTEIDLKTLGFKGGEVIIVGGETEEDIRADIAPLITPETKDRKHNYFFNDQFLREP